MQIHTDQRVLSLVDPHISRIYTGDYYDQVWLLQKF